MYYSDVKEVICTENLICNKRISNAGQEWSARRPGNRPIGANDATRDPETCLGAYATHTIVQPPHTGHNTMSSIKHHQEDPNKKIMTSPLAYGKFFRKTGSRWLRVASNGGTTSAQTAILYRRSIEWCPHVDVYCQSLVRYHSGRALNVVDIHCITVTRSSLRMVYSIGDAYWVSRRLDNIASSHAGTF